MRTLVVEDDFISRKLLNTILSKYGDCDIAVDGQEGLSAFALSHEEGRPYDFVCLDIMMPNMDGHEALKGIRDLEKKIGVKPANETKILMITALDDPKNVFEAFYGGGATGYIVKPVLKEKLNEKLKEFGLL